VSFAPSTRASPARFTSLKGTGRSHQFGSAEPVENRQGDFPVALPQFVIAPPESLR
jgi:hypothetical protein